MNKSATGLIAPGIIFGAILLGLGPLIKFAIEHGGFAGAAFDPTIFHILWFTLKQALLSTLISVMLGLAAARALVRRRFFGRGFLLNLFALPQALPAIVVVLCITAIYGAHGLGINIYGLTGILLAHVFFNVPLATRLFMEALNTIAPENFRLAEQLAFSDKAIFWNIEWPALRNVLPKICGLIFLMCAASFVIVLTLGGPSATTLEVAIYQSLRQDFDVARALNLASLQIALCVALALISGRMIMHPPLLPRYKLPALRRDGRNLISKLFDATAITIAAFLVLPPIMALIIYGLPNLAINTTAFGTSLLISVCSAVVVLNLAWPLAKRGGFMSNVSALAALIVPPAVLATGWFLALRGFDQSLLVVTLSIIALNALMALPFCAAILAPSIQQSITQNDRLCAQLGLKSWNRFFHIDMPLMKKPLAQAFVMACVLSLGDLTAVTLLGTQGIVTLPSLIHAQMGNYRGNAAMGTALLLAALCYALAQLAQHLGRAR
jgi:thiamine transport system permease protein